MIPEGWVEFLALRGAVVIEVAAGLVILLSSVRAGWRTVEPAWVRHMGARAADAVAGGIGVIGGAAGKG